MDLRVEDGHIIPVTHRIVCDLSLLPDDFAFPTGDRAVLAYSAAERDAITADLDELKIPYSIEAVDQPDPTLLAACQGKVRTRTEALTARAAGKAPVTLADLDQRLTAVEPAQIEP